MDEQFARDLLMLLGNVGIIEVIYRPTCLSYDICWCLFDCITCIRFSDEFIRQISSEVSSTYATRQVLLENAVGQFRQQSARGLTITEPLGTIASRIRFRLGHTGVVRSDYDIVSQVYVLTWSIFDVNCVIRFTQWDLRCAGETPFVSHVARIFRAQSKQTEQI